VSRFHLAARCYMANWNRGQKNGFWKGGRSTASNGYMLIRVGTDHHLADVRGYAYEHRIVAEQKIGRRLLPGEQVHHIDGNKQNNWPDNLLVVTAPEHGVCHRKPTSALVRMPGESNPIVLCACGCGTELVRYDQVGRQRRYVSGHNPRIATTQTAILDVLSKGPASIEEIVARCQASRRAIKVCLSRMNKAGRVYRADRGVYALKEGAVWQRIAA
jgi:hypothetical protein